MLEAVSLGLRLAEALVARSCSGRAPVQAGRTEPPASSSIWCPQQLLPLDTGASNCPRLLFGDQLA